MSKHNPDGWTFASLVTHLTALRADDQRAIGAALASAEKRADASNEIRGAMIDQQKHFATQEKVDGLADRLGKLENQQAVTGGKSQGVALVVAGIGTAISLLIAVGGITMAYLG